MSSRPSRVSARAFASALVALLVEALDTETCLACEALAPPSLSRQWAEVEANRLCEKNGGLAVLERRPRPGQRYLGRRPETLAELEESLASHLCPRCLARWPLSMPQEVIAAEQAEIFAFFPYSEQVKQAFLRLKFAYLKREAYLLAALLARQFLLFERAPLTRPYLVPPGALVCPFPGTKRRDRQRGFNPIGLILDILSPLYGWRPIPDLLYRRGEPRYQHELDSRRERFASARDSLAVRDDVARCYRGEKIYLWDDIVTTGASLLAAHEVLEEAGFSVQMLAVAGGKDYFRRRWLTPAAGFLPSIGL